MRSLRPFLYPVRLPIWLVQLGTGAKSFLDNPLIGSVRLNRLGLHRRRVMLAMSLAKWRRRRLARHVPPAWREAFDRDGFVAIEGLLPHEEFDRLRAALLDHAAPAREMRQGDAITRRIAVDPEILSVSPELRAMLSRRDIRALFHYAASFAIEPLHYIQTILTHCDKAPPDPQLSLHADAFHPSMKAWFFLNDVRPGDAPFTYVPGSNHLSRERLDWEYRRSQMSPERLDRLSARGSPRILEEELASLGLPQPRALAVPANTLVVADTFGFHARGASTGPVRRVEIWSYARRNPFIPWLGADLLSLPGIAERRVGWLWHLRDRLERFVGQPWQPAGMLRPLDGGPDGDQVPRVTAS